MKKSILILLAYYCIGMLACVKCHCPAPSQGFINFNNVSSHFLSYTISGNSYTYESFNGDSIATEQMGISIDLDYALALQNSSQHYLSCISTAYACDCVTGIYRLKDSIATIALISKQDINDSLRNGTDVTKEFAYLTYNDWGNIEYYPILEGLKYINQQYYTEGRHMIPLIWNNKDIHHQTVQFEIIVTLKSGKQLNNTSKAIKLL